MGAVGQKTVYSSANIEVKIDTLNDNVGAKDDASATTDTGTFSLIALVKRWLEKATVMVTKLTSLDAKDYATESTLSSMSTALAQEATLANISGGVSDLLNGQGLLALESGGNLANIVLAQTDGSQVTKISNSFTVKSAGGVASSSGNNTLIASVSSKKIKVLSFCLSTTSATAVTCIFQSGAGGTELYRVVLQAMVAATDKAMLATNIPARLFETASATLLNLNLSAAASVHWSVSYIEEA